jgi:hypothetical protein
MANNPQFAATPRFSVGFVTVADTNRGGTGTVPSSTNAVSVLIANVSTGSRVDEVTITGIGTTAADMVRLFVVNTANIANANAWGLYKEIPTVATTPSSTVPAFSATYTFNNFVIPAGYQLRASANLATGGYAITAFGGDF